MQALDFINTLIPPLKPNDPVRMALSWMEEIRTNVLPVVEQAKFLGFLHDDTIYDRNQPEQLVSEMPLMGIESFVYTDQHIYDVLQVSREENCQIVAVLDRTMHYQGVVTMEDAISAFADSISIQSQGSVLVLSMHMSDYHLEEIARLIESENTKILSSFISSDPLDAGKIKLTLKLDKPELRFIKATLERFGYKIIDHYQESGESSSEKDRLDNLLRLLDI